MAVRRVPCPCAVRPGAVGVGDTPCVIPSMPWVLNKFEAGIVEVKERESESCALCLCYVCYPYPVRISAPYTVYEIHITRVFL